MQTSTDEPSTLAEHVVDSAAADCLSPDWDPLQYPIDIKIADLGNACWVVRK